ASDPSRKGTIRSGRNIPADRRWTALEPAKAGAGLDLEGAVFVFAAAAADRGIRRRVRVSSDFARVLIYPETDLQPGDTRWTNYSCRDEADRDSPGTTARENGDVGRRVEFDTARSLWHTHLNRKRSRLEYGHGRRKGRLSESARYCCEFADQRKLLYCRQAGGQPGLVARGGVLVQGALLDGLIQGGDGLAVGLLSGSLVALGKGLAQFAQLGAQAGSIGTIARGAAFGLTGALQRGKMICHVCFVTFV